MNDDIESKDPQDKNYVTRELSPKNKAENLVKVVFRQAS